MAVTVRQLEVLFNSLSKLSDAADRASERTMELQARFAGMEKEDAGYAKVKKELAESQREEKRLKVETNKKTREQNKLVGENTQSFKTLVENTRDFNVAALQLKGEFNDIGDIVDKQVASFGVANDMVATFGAQAEKASNRLDAGYSDEGTGPAFKAKKEKQLSAAEFGKDTAQILAKVAEQNTKNIGLVGTDEFTAMDAKEGEKLLERITKLKEMGVDISDDDLKILKENAESQVALGDAQRRSNEIVNLTTKATQELGNQFKNILGDIPLIGGFLGDKVGGALMDLGATLKKNVVQSLYSAIAASRGLTAGMVGATGATTAFGTAMTFATAGLNIVIALLVAAAAALAVMAVKARDFSGEVGIAFRESVNLQGTLTKSQALMIGLGQSSSAIAGELIEAFGTIEKVTTGNIVQIGKLATKFGASTSDIISIQKQLMDMTGASADSSAELISNIGRLATAEGVGAGNVIADIASNMATFAEFSTMGAQGLAEAAVQAAKVGSSLANVNAFAEKLIDFETSITAEFEAQVLTGKNLNLERARELALQGKMGELSQELQAQVGGLGEIQSMNVIEKRAISAAIGVSVADLQKISRGEAIEQKKTQEDLLSELIEVNKKGFKGNEAAFGKGDTSFNNFMNYGD